MASQVGRVSRRDFLRASALGLGAAVGAGIIEPVAAQQKADEIPLRPLGKTGLQVSAIGFGSFGFSNPAVLEAAIDRGVKFICTSADYQNGNAERAIGEVMKKRRDEVVLCTGWPARMGAIAGDILKSLDDSLGRLQTDHVDIFKVHMCDNPEILGQPGVLEAFAKAKEAGKARFFGVSGHGKNLPAVYEEAIRLKAYHMLMGKYNFIEYANMSEVIKQAGEQGLGVVAFKVTAGKQEPLIQELTGKGMDFHRACVKWALSNENVSSVLEFFKSLDDVNGLTVGLGEPLSEYDQRLLATYREAVQHTYCRYCGTCAIACPYGVEVADIMRYAMYFRFYGHQKDAIRLYAEVSRESNAARCARCAGHCIGQCPHGLHTRNNLVNAHMLLT